MNHLWQSTLFTVAIGLLTLALRNNRAPVRYGLWFAASVKFLIPFSLLVTLGSQLEWRQAPLLTPMPTMIAMHQVSKPFPSLPASNPQTPVNGPAILFCIWLCGFSAVVIAWTRQWSRIRSTLRAASPLPLNLPIRAMSSPARLEPGVFGIFRPVLLLPEGIHDRLTPAQWDAILAHELCHVRRRDNLTAAIHMAVEAIFWFHPLVWWIGKRLMEERERACDEEVLLAAIDPETYAQGILNVCKFYTESPLRCMSGVTGSNLKKRVRAIMTQPIADKLDFGRKLLLVAAGIVSVIGPVAIGILKAPPLRAQSPPPAVERVVPAAPANPPPAPRLLAQNQTNPTPIAPKSQPAPADPPANVATVEMYVIGANDVLAINVSGQRDFTSFYVVKTDGTVTMPLVGAVKAAGLTLRQLQQQLTDALSQFIRDPEVSVSVFDARPMYSVVGTVQRPGNYPLRQPTTVFNALNEAGGFTEFSNQRDIVIIRGDQRLHFNYKDYIKGENVDPNIALQSGDTILVK